MNAREKAVEGLVQALMWAARIGERRYEYGDTFADALRLTDVRLDGPYGDHPNELVDRPDWQALAEQTLIELNLVAVDPTLIASADTARADLDLVRARGDSGSREENLWEDSRLALADAVLAQLEPTTRRP